MPPDFLAAIEWTAKAIRDGVAELRRGFSDSEQGDYLSCAGCDGLAEALCERESLWDVSHHHVYETIRDWRPNTSVAVNSPATDDDPAAVSDDHVGSPNPSVPLAERTGEGPTDDCAILSAPSVGLPTIAELFADMDDAIDQPLSAVAELDWPYLAKALRIVADFFDPK